MGPAGSLSLSPLYPLQLSSNPNFGWLDFGWPKFLLLLLCEGPAPACCFRCSPPAQPIPLDRTDTARKRNTAAQAPAPPPSRQQKLAVGWSDVGEGFRLWMVSAWGATGAGKRPQPLLRTPLDRSLIPRGHLQRPGLRPAGLGSTFQRANAPEFRPPHPLQSCTPPFFLLWKQTEVREATEKAPDLSLISVGSHGFPEQHSSRPLWRRRRPL